MDAQSHLGEGEELVGDDLILRFEPPMNDTEQKQPTSDPEIVDAEVLMHSKKKEAEETDDKEKKSLWFKIVSVLGIIFAALIGLPKETKSMIANTIVDKLDKKNEEKKRKLSETVTPVETT